MSQACGERVLFPTVRGTAADDLVVAAGFSCHYQIADFCDNRRTCTRPSCYYCRRIIMTKLPDLRFIEPGYELMLLAEYLKLLKANLPNIVSNEEARIWSEFDRSDEADRTTGWHLVDRLQSGITTRFLTASVVVATWALYEASVDDIAQYIRGERQVELRMSELRGGLLQRARRYFKDVLKFELHPQGTDWARLDHLAELRHVLAHTNGRVEDISADKRKKFLAWVEATPGIEVVDDEYVVVSMDFASATLQLIENLVDELVERVRATF